MTEDRHCPRCDSDLPISAFGFRDAGHTRLQSYCRDCQNTASRDWYSKPRNRDHHRNLVRTRRRRRIARHRALVAKLKARPCADCGKQHPPYVMDFDHIADKIMEISRMVHTVGTETLLDEIDKCDVVCANCHRVRTHLRARDVRKTE